MKTKEQKKRIVDDAQVQDSQSAQEVLRDEGIKNFFLTCLRPLCGHVWMPNNPELRPKACPKCKSYYWDRPVKSLEL